MTEDLSSIQKTPDSPPRTTKMEGRKEGRREGRKTEKKRKKDHCDMSITEERREIETFRNLSIKLFS